MKISLVFRPVPVEARFNEEEFIEAGISRLLFTMYADTDLSGLPEGRINRYAERSPDICG